MTSNERASTWPITLPIAHVAVAASKAVTVTAWVKKSHATDIAAKLVCKGYQIAGVDS